MTDTPLAAVSALALYEGRPRIQGAESARAFIHAYCEEHQGRSEALDEHLSAADDLAVTPLSRGVLGLKLGELADVVDGAIALAATPDRGLSNLAAALFFLSGATGHEGVYAELRREAERISREAPARSSAHAFAVGLALIGDAGDDFWIALRDGELCLWDEVVTRVSRLPGLRLTTDAVRAQTDAHERLAEQLDQEFLDAGLDADPISSAIDDYREDRSGIRRRLSRPARAPVSGPSLVVVGSLDHLGDKTRSPRREFRDFENAPLPLRPVPDLQAVADRLIRRFPWWRKEILRIVATQVGRAWVKLPPILLDGPPGAGKTALAIALADAFGIASVVYSCAGVADGSFGGTSRQWSTVRVSVPGQLLFRERVANGLVILDEVEKAGTGTQNGSLVDAMLPFLSETTAARVQDPALECSIDTSGVSYVMTSNRRDRVHGALLDRCRVVRLSPPGREHMPVILAGMLDDVRRERGLDERWLFDLDDVERRAISRVWRGGSMRGLRTALDAILSARDTLAPRN